MTLLAPVSVRHCGLVQHNGDFSFPLKVCNPMRINTAPVRHGRQRLMMRFPSATLTSRKPACEEFANFILDIQESIIKVRFGIISDRLKVGGYFLASLRASRS